MTMKFVYFTNFALLLWGGLTLGQPQFETLGFQLRFIDAQLDSLAALDKNATAKIDSLAEEISTLKVQKHLGYFERRQLEHKLKESQAFVRQQQELQAEISVHKVQRKALTDQLIDDYSFTIDSLLTRAEQGSPMLSPEEKASLLRQVQTLRARRDFVLSKVVPKPEREQKEVLVEILPADTPREIEEKADYLNDQEDKLRREAARISAQVKDLREESDLRLRMSELMDDIRLFDQREEPLSPSDVAGALTKTESMGRTYWTNAPLDAAVEGVTTLPTVTDQIFTIDLSNVTLDDINDLISSLELHEHKLSHRADSLSAVAEKFRKQAKQMRDILNFNR